MNKGSRSLAYNYQQWSIQQKNNHKLTCEICKDQKEKSKELVCHHLVPIRMNGINIEMLMSVDNILVICHNCHDILHGKHVAVQYTEDEFISGGSLKNLYKFSKLEPHFNRYEANRIKKQYA
jgi:hypothetical protein